MSRAARESVGDLVALVKASPAFPESVKASLPSPQLMALKVLEALVRKLREYGNHDSILPQGAVNTLVGIVAPFAGVKEYPRALEKSSRIATLELAMSILESYSLGGRVEFGRELSQDELSKLAAVFPTMLNWAQGVNLGTDHDLGMSILIAIRLYINISNEQPDVSDVIGPLLTPAVVGLVKKSFAVLEGTPEEQERKAYQDILILSFGLLLNFAESSAASRESVRTIGEHEVQQHQRLSTDYPAAISEDTDGTGIEELLDIFTAKLQKTAEACPPSLNYHAIHANVQPGAIRRRNRSKCRLGLPLHPPRRALSRRPRPVPCPLAAQRRSDAARRGDRGVYRVQ